MDDEIEPFMVASTNAACLFCLSEKDGDRTFWVPRSLIDYMRKDPPIAGEYTRCYVRMPDWKASQLGLI